MKCPHCNNTLKYPQRAWRNVTNYGTSLQVTTECCFNIIRLTPVTTIHIEKSEGLDHGNGPVDDWDIPQGEKGKIAYEQLDIKIAYKKLDSKA